MNIFNLFHKDKPATRQQKRAITRKIIKNMSGARYKVVSGYDQTQREQGTVESLNEDEILDASKRGKMLDLARNAVRNSATLNCILKQFDLHGVGTVGGKAIFNFPDLEVNKTLKKEFSKWTRESEFFDGMSLNTTLKVILKTYLLGGDCVILFDDGLIEDSGKILIYEPDEIGNTTEEALKSHFGIYAKQSNGKIYNENGRFIGVVVSRSQRGATEFDPNKSYFLKRDPNGYMFDCDWLMPRNVFREAQGRGVSPMASVIATIHDLEDTVGFEIQAAKKNALTFATITHQSDETDNGVLPSAFASNTDFSNMTEAEIEEASKEEVEDTHTETVSLDVAHSAGIEIQQMPDNYNMNLIDTKHPNQNMQDFINWLCLRSSSPLGLTEQFATLAATGADYKAQQLLAQPAFAEVQKFLEQILDWVFWKWLNWAQKKQIITTSLDSDCLDCISWEWASLEQLDEVQHQNAIDMKLHNMTSNYKEILGNNWRERLLQFRDEVNWCKENNILHPIYQLKSGGESQNTQTDVGTADNI